MRKEVESSNFQEQKS